MNARAVKQVVGRVAAWVEPVGLAEDCRVAVGGNPVQRNTLARADMSSCQFYRLCGHAPAGHQRAVYAQDFVDGSGQQVRLGAQALLQLDMFGQIVRQDADSRCNRADLTHRPVAQDAGNFAVAQQLAVDFLGQQAGGNVVLRVFAGRVPAA